MMYHGRDLVTLSNTRNGRRRGDGFIRQEIGDGQLRRHQDAAFTPCGCAVYAYAGVACAPVERSREPTPFHGRHYRCLVCGATWDDVWLDEKIREVHAHVG